VCEADNDSDEENYYLSSSMYSESLLTGASFEKDSTTLSSPGASTSSKSKTKNAKKKIKKKHRQQSDGENSKARKPWSVSARIARKKKNSNRRLSKSDDEASTMGLTGPWPASTKSNMKKSRRKTGSKANVVNRQQTIQPALSPDLDEYSETNTMTLGRKPGDPALVECLKFYYCDTAANCTGAAIKKAGRCSKVDDTVAQRHACLPRSPKPNVEMVLQEYGHDGQPLQEAPNLRSSRSFVREVSGLNLSLDADPYEWNDLQSRANIQRQAAESVVDVRTIEIPSTCSSYSSHSNWSSASEYSSPRRRRTLFGGGRSSSSRYTSSRTRRSKRDGMISRLRKATHRRSL